MASANDNEAKRRVRDGYLRHWKDANFAEIASDEALQRIAEARNTSSGSANRFMILASLTAFLYLLRLEGIANDLSLAQYKLKDIPFGLFVLSAAATSLSTISLIRTGDSRAYDRQLRLACEKKYNVDCHLRYVVFPNEKAWGEPFSTMSSVIDAGRIMVGIRFAALLLINLFLLGLVVGPLATGADFLISHRYLGDTGYQNLRFWVISFLTTANGLTLLLMLWARLADRE